MTPGPWRVVERDNLSSWSVQDMKGKRIAACKWPIRFAGQQLDKARNEARENANLIAAAPDLLEALEMIVRNHRQGYIVTVANIQHIESAINKAIGKP